MKRYVEGEDGMRWCRVVVLDEFLDGLGVLGGLRRGGKGV